MEFTKLKTRHLIHNVKEMNNVNLMHGKPVGCCIVTIYFDSQDIPSTFQNKIDLSARTINVEQAINLKNDVLAAIESKIDRKTKKSRVRRWLQRSSIAALKLNRDKLNAMNWADDPARSSDQSNPDPSSDQSDLNSGVAEGPAATNGESFQVRPDYHPTPLAPIVGHLDDSLPPQSLATIVGECGGREEGEGEGEGVGLAVSSPSPSPSREKDEDTNSTGSIAKKHSPLFSGYSLDKAVLKGFHADHVAEQRKCRRAVALPRLEQLEEFALKASQARSPFDCINTSRLGWVDFKLPKEIILGIIKQNYEPTTAEQFKIDCFKLGELCHQAFKESHNVSEATNKKDSIQPVQKFMQQNMLFRESVLSCSEGRNIVGSYLGDGSIWLKQNKDLKEPQLTKMYCSSLRALALETMRLVLKKNLHHLNAEELGNFEKFIELRRIIATCLGRHNSPYGTPTPEEIHKMIFDITGQMVEEQKKLALAEEA